MLLRHEAPRHDLAVKSFGDPEDPPAAWTLDELDHLSDLESVQAAWRRADDPDA